MKKLKPEDLDKLSKQSVEATENWIKVGMSTCGIAAGADIVMATLVEESKKRNIEVEIRQCGCAGKCFAEPLVEVNVKGAPRVTYGAVDKETAIAILENHVRNKKLVIDHIFI